MLSIQMVDIGSCSFEVPREDAKYVVNKTEPQ